MSASAAEFARNPTGKLHDLDDRIDRLLLVVEAMWSLLADAGMAESDLATRVEELDAQDGSVDGYRVPTVDTCPECEAAVNRGTGHCQFCGHDLGGASPFAGV